MNKLLLSLCLALWLPLAGAVAPYVQAERVAAGELRAVMAQVEKKLVADGFEVVGRHTPTGLPQHGTVVVTDREVLAAVRNIGGRAIAAAAIRVGVKADGSVSYMNPEYWYRAYLRKQYGGAEAAVKAAGERLARSLGGGKGFGGDVAADELPNYRYMVGMERFDAEKSELRTYASFDEALRTVRDNLAKGTRHTARVYEIVFADRRLAVFGVAMNDAEDGEGWWVRKIGADHIAALPWEVFIVDNKVYGLAGRYRTALGWPTLGMGAFMGIGGHPDSTLEMLMAVAGGKVERSGY